MKTDSGDQQPDILNTPKQNRFVNFLEQIREEQKYTDTQLFNKYFSYGRPDEMLQDLFYSKSRLIIMRNWF